MFAEVRHRPRATLPPEGDHQASGPSFASQLMQKQSTFICRESAGEEELEPKFQRFGTPCGETVSPVGRRFWTNTFFARPQR